MYIFFIQSTQLNRPIFLTSNDNLTDKNIDTICQIVIKNSIVGLNKNDVNIICTKTTNIRSVDGYLINFKDEKKIKIFVSSLDRSIKTPKKFETFAFV